MARAGGADEPYRALLRDLRERLSATLRAIEDRLDGAMSLDPFPFVSAAELAEPLALCRRSLEQTGNGLLARGRLLDLQRRLAAFGVTLVRLDLRQDASRHTEALSAITTHLGLGDYADVDRRRSASAFCCRSWRAAARWCRRTSTPSPEVREVLETFRVAALLPQESLGAYVISMTMRPSDVLAVELLQKEARVAAPQRVVPAVRDHACARGCRHASWRTC